MSTSVPVVKEFEDTLGNKDLAQDVTKDIPVQGSIRLLMSCKKHDRADFKEFGSYNR